MKSKTDIEERQRPTAPGEATPGSIPGSPGDGEEQSAKRKASPFEPFAKQMLRLACLKLAIDAKSGPATADNVITNARVMERYVVEENQDGKETG